MDRSFSAGSWLLLRLTCPKRIQPLALRRLTIRTASCLPFPHDQPVNRHHLQCCKWTLSRIFLSSHTALTCQRSIHSIIPPQALSMACTSLTSLRCFCDSRHGPTGPGDELWTGDESDRDLMALAEDIISATCRQDVMATALHPQSVVDLLSDLSVVGFPLRTAAGLLSGRLWLLQEPSAVVAIADTLGQHGFHHQVTADFLENLPPEYCIQDEPLEQIPDSINQSLLQLRDLGFSGKSLLRVVGRCPQVLLEDPKTLRSVFTRLKALFTAADAVRVAVTCPNVFSQPWVETNKVFDYAFFTMGYPQPQIVSAEVLACPLHTLQDRHVFLTRAGFFVRVREKDDPRLNPNPPLREVVKSSDENFASKFGELSVEEYSAFLAMREIEREEEEELEISDSDSDSSDSSDSESDSGIERNKPKKKY